jgi:hypothetical protein
VSVLGLKSRESWGHKIRAFPIPLGVWARLLLRIAEGV